MLVFKTFLSIDFRVLTSEVGLKFILKDWGDDLVSHSSPNIHCRLLKVSINQSLIKALKIINVFLW
jgi:hypothetical protein